MLILVYRMQTTPQLLEVHFVLTAWVVHCSQYHLGLPMAFSNWAKCWETPLPPKSTLSPFYFPRYFFVGKMLTTLVDECAFLKAVITSHINSRENGRKIKTFCHPTPYPHTLKNSGMGNWRVLAYVRLMLHFEEKGKLLFHLFGPRQIDGKLRTPLAPKEKK